MASANFQNEAYVLHGIDDARMQKYPMPKQPGPNEVLIRSMSTGICGSDLHYLKEMHLGNIIITEPMVLGHEASGQVVAVGSDVKHLKAGDRVCYEPSVPCLKCDFCDTRDYNLCEFACSTMPPYTGSLTYYYLHNADFVFKVPDNVTAEEAAMVEPLCVAVHACKRGYITVGDHVLITGAGPIGLLTLMVAKAYGATRVVLTDINKERLKLADELGADATILVDKKWDEQRLVEEIKKNFHNDLPNKTFECSGVGSNFRLVFLATKASGVATLVGMGPTELTLPIADAANREVTIRSCYRYKGCFPLAIELAASGKLQLTKLISHRYSFHDCDKAFDTAVRGAGMKVMIKVGEDTV